MLITYFIQAEKTCLLVGLTPVFPVDQCRLTTAVVNLTKFLLNAELRANDHICQLSMVCLVMQSMSIYQLRNKNFWRVL